MKIDSDEQFELLILLLELPFDLLMFLRILKKVISPSVGTIQKEDTEEEKKRDEEVGSEGSESPEELVENQKYRII